MAYFHSAGSLTAFFIAHLRLPLHFMYIETFAVNICVVSGIWQYIYIEKHSLHNNKNKNESGLSAVVLVCEPLSKEISKFSVVPNL